MYSSKLVFEMCGSMINSKCDLKDKVQKFEIILCSSCEMRLA